MRKLIFTAMLVLLSIMMQAQNEMLQVHNFVLTEGNVYWQKVYTDVDSSAVSAYFNNSFFEKKGSDNYQCVVTLKNYSDKGYMNRAFILNDESTIYFTVQLKEDKYRVTVTDIIWKSINTIYGISTASTSDLKSYAYNKKGKIKFKEGGGIEEQLDAALSLLFDASNNLQNKAVLDSDF